MKDFLAQRWFLLFLVSAVGLAWVFPEALAPSTRSIGPLAVVPPALFLIAWTLDGRSLYRAVLQPWPALWAFLISYTAVPALGWLAGRLLPRPDLQIGLMISTSAPCTLASAVLWTRMAGGSEATALLVTLLTTSTSWLVTTGWLLAATGSHVDIAPAALMRELLVVLVVPVALGQAARAAGPLARAADRFRPAIGVVSRLLILVVILKAAVAFRQKLGDPFSGWGAGLVTTAAVCMGVHLLALAGGFLSAGGLGFDRPNRIAVAFSCSQKTLPVALLVFERHFSDFPLALVPLVCYHGCQLVVDTFIADRWGGRRLAVRELNEGAAV